ncbi:MAG: hypothetical protein H0W99_11065 [Acidobacteria bacterium]|nr:hypothetical protein [Acidobacteriota bacterium]
MRVPALLVMIVFLSVTGRAQTTPSVQGPTDVSVIKFSWDKERIGWERDPFGASGGDFIAVRRRINEERQLERAKNGGNREEELRLTREVKLRREDEAKARQAIPKQRYGFRYKLSVKNTGAKIIKTIDWDYLFFDAATGEKIGHQQFTNDEKIGPDKEKTLEVFVPTPPARVISIQALNQKENERLFGQVILMRIVYADGSIWERP